MADHNNSDSESILISVPDYIEFLLRQSYRTGTKHILYPGQIAYSLGFLAKISSKKPERDRSSSSKSFVNLRMAESHKQIVRILQMLSSIMDNERPDKPISLKHAKIQPD